MKVMKVRVRYTEPLLGSLPFDEELHDTYIASKAPNALSREEEVASFGVDMTVEKGMTGFSRSSNGTPIVWDYQFKGFMKESAYFMKQATGSKSMEAAKKKGCLVNYRQKIDGLLYIIPRMIPLVLPEGKEPGRLQRPLRAQTAQGPRVAIADSESVPVGTTAEFYVLMLDEAFEPLVREWLDYGILHGNGQWRSGGMGRFKWQEIECDMTADELIASLGAE